MYCVVVSIELSLDLRVYLIIAAIISQNIHIHSSRLFSHHNAFKNANNNEVKSLKDDNKKLRMRLSNLQKSVAL